MPKHLGDEPLTERRAKKAKEEEDPPQYLLDGDLRRVQPYWHVFNATAKSRWFNRTLLDIFSGEFRYRTVEYYREAIANGTISVVSRTRNPGAPVEDYLVKNGDLIVHRMHRHEPPVRGSLSVVWEDEDVLVVDKPSSIPVHPTGRYRHNTVLNILKYEMGHDNLHNINRLDRMTSGILVLAKNINRARVLEQAMRDRFLQKTYLARVRGIFPDGEVICDAPIRTVSHKLALNLVDYHSFNASTKAEVYNDPSSGSKKKATGGRKQPDAPARASITRFRRLQTDGISSVVECKPMTGRTHQIRTHLLHLGHPIANDAIYAVAQVERLASLVHLRKDPSSGADLDDEEVDKAVAEWVAHRLQQMQDDESEEVSAAAAVNEGESPPLEVCEECCMPFRTDIGDTEMWLHALVYEYVADGDDEKMKPWRYETSWPNWATLADAAINDVIL